jgi:cytoskeletal protein CcmA (bactofilin family)
MAKTNGTENGTVNLIGTGTIIQGDVKSDGDFRIDGTLIGSIESKGKIVVGTTGSIEGEVKCKNADVSGKMSANIFVSQLLSLKATSSFSGEVKTGKLAIEPGAKFTGTCQMVTDDLLSGKQAGNAKIKS